MWPVILNVLCLIESQTTEEQQIQVWNQAQQIPLEKTRGNTKFIFFSKTKNSNSISNVPGGNNAVLTVGYDLWVDKTGHGLGMGG